MLASMRLKSSNRKECGRSSRCSHNWCVYNLILENGFPDIQLYQLWIIHGSALDTLDFILPGLIGLIEKLFCFPGTRIYSL